MKRELIILIFCILLFSCKKEEGCTDPIALNYNIDATIEDESCIYPSIKNFNIGFGASVNGMPLELGQTGIFPFTNHSNDIYNIQTLRYIISDITIHADDDTKLLLDEVHFVDLSIDSTLTLTIPEIILNKQYTSISFTMGLDSTKNITNLFLNENFFPSFAWPDILGGGYHYMQLEGDFNTVFNGYATHTGPTNGIDFSFSKTFSIYINNRNSIYIMMEIPNWYQNPEILNFTTNGIMGNINSQEILRTNGIEDVFYLWTSESLK